MKKLIYLTILVTLAANTCYAIDIDVDNRIKNRSVGYCAWCSLETLGRHHNINKLIGLVDRRQQIRTVVKGKLVENGGAVVPDTLASELKRIGVKYWQQARGKKDTNILKKANDKNLGCVVGLKDYPIKDKRHAVVLLDWGEEVNFIDPNDIKTTKRMSRKEFMSYWTGGTLVLNVKSGPPPIMVAKNGKSTSTTKSKPDRPTNTVKSKPIPPADPGPPVPTIRPAFEAAATYSFQPAANARLLYKPQVLYGSP